MKYLEIYSALKKSMMEREFESANRLPSEPELCRRFTAARNTVRQALALLQKEGLIETVKGKGAFITKRGERKTGIIGLLIPDFSSASFFATLAYSFTSWNFAHLSSPSVALPSKIKGSKIIILTFGKRSFVSSINVR